MTARANHNTRLAELEAKRNALVDTLHQQQYARERAILGADWPRWNDGMVDNQLVADHAALWALVEADPEWCAIVRRILLYERWKGYQEALR